jgi:protein-S-isoprenylcysteine O-methyltransferase Ste14
VSGANHVLDKRDPNRHAGGVTVFAQGLALLGLFALFVGMPIAAWVVVGHWLAPLVVCALAVACTNAFTRDW